jgi:hypothetical protein
MNAFIITATIFFLFLAFIWSRKDWKNLIIKMAFYALAGWGGFLIFQAAGFIVKT